MNNKALMATLRRDASYVGNAIMALIFVSFAALALAATLLDLASLHP